MPLLIQLEKSLSWEVPKVAKVPPEEVRISSIKSDFYFSEAFFAYICLAYSQIATN